MSMNEEYLDNLLKSMEQKEAAMSETESEPLETGAAPETESAPLETEAALEAESVPSEKEAEAEMAPLVSDVQNMTEEEITKLLQESERSFPKENEADKKQDFSGSQDPEPDEDFMLDADLQTEDALLEEPQEESQKEPQEEPQEELQKESQEEPADNKKKARTRGGKKFSFSRLFGKKGKNSEEKADIGTEVEKGELEEDSADTQESLSTEETADALQKQDTEHQPDEFDAYLKNMFAGPEDEENSGDESTQKQAEEASEEEKVSKKKSGFFKRFMEFLAEEDEEEDEGGSEAKQAVADTVSDGKGQILSGASEENKEALAQLDKEDKEQRKRKKKKDKKKKETGGTGKIQKTGEDADEAEDPKKNEEPKAGQSEKEKKEKNPKETKNEEDQLVKIPKKNLRATMLFSLTIVVAVLLCCLFVPELFELRSARNAYYKGDYEKCFRTFYGKHLSENDRIMYEHSVMQLLIGRKEEAYQSYVAVGDELRALDVLLQAVKEQDALLAEAEKYGLADAEAEQYKKVLSILSDKYGLNEAAAKEINAYKEDAVYTLRLKSIVEKTPFTLPDYIDAEAYNMASVSGADEDSTVQITDEMSGTEQDLLPAEEELSDTNFTDNTN